MNTMMNTMMKVCKACGKKKPLNEFYLVSTSDDGHYAVCKDCSEVPVKRKQHNIRRTKGTKICRICGKTKLLSAFYDNPETLDGKSQRCKECNKEYDKKMSKIKKFANEYVKDFMKSLSKKYVSKK